jgi:hypothetical protein
VSTTSPPHIDVIPRAQLTVYFTQVRGVDVELAAARVHADADAGICGEVIHLYHRALQRN